MKTEIKDVLHLYLGSDMVHTGDGKPFRGTSKVEKLTIENFELLSFSTQRKLSLRKLSDMTEEERKNLLVTMNSPANVK
jgi:hypothetical protein